MAKKGKMSFDGIVANSLVLQKHPLRAANVISILQ